ncbi:Autophagy protein Apg5 family isoform 1 [Theobroma cacao]|uniref:Autophagy protein 5 n=1 Tax=Theobroma cacao TaxID=3641 RepID=A0A061EDZ8_THECC|nr:Autophagy protein Apg5 family isoform 1 [Theobroma cacao]
MRKAIQKRMEAKKYVWEGAIPLQIHLHESQVTTLPPPPPALILAPRIGYLPLLVPLIKPHFSSTLPPGVDTIWFEYRGLPLKCQNQPPNGGFFCCRYIPTGVLFDLLCAEPERPWNITVHFRGYPGNVLIPCDGEDSVKWSFINSLKEAAYIINGNCKNVMNMSQSDQLELWHSVMNDRVPCDILDDENRKLHTLASPGWENLLFKVIWRPTYGSRLSLNLQQLRMSIQVCVHQNLNKALEKQILLDRSRQLEFFIGWDNADINFPHTFVQCRVPVRLYVWSISEDFDDWEDLSQVDSWEKISYINRPIEIHKEGKCFTLHDAMKSLLPEFFSDESLSDSKLARVDFEDAQKIPSEDVSSNKVVEDQGQNAYEHREACCISSSAEIKLIRIQGIEPKLEIPFSWLVNNLLNPDHFLHICVCVKVPQ